MTSEPGGDQPGGGQRVREGDVTFATFGYLGAIFLGPVIPLLLYALQARKSQFMRYHAATAVNLSLTGALYALCCVIIGGLLLLDSVAVALIVVLPLGFVIWVSVLRYLIRGVIAANRGESYEVPRWICAHIVRLGRLGLGQPAGHGVGEQAAAAGEHDPALCQGVPAGQALSDD